MTTGTSVYRISTGRLYCTCRGSSSVRRRKAMIAKKIRPQTKTPTASDAMTEPYQIVVDPLDCAVMPFGIPETRQLAGSDRYQQKGAGDHPCNEPTATSPADRADHRMASR